MFGLYENFPEIFHGVARFSYTTSPENLQRVLIQCMYRLNYSNEGLNFPEFAQHNIKVEMEFGVAEGITFNYLDREILKAYQGKLDKQVLPALDFLCIVLYYVLENERRKPLRFDYYMLRFLFNEKEVELRVYHEKGTRRLASEELIMFLKEKINRELARKKLSPLKMSYIRTV